MTGSPLTGYSVRRSSPFSRRRHRHRNLVRSPARQSKRHQEPIKEDGTITMPDIGHVQAAGKTAGELQNEIYNLYVPKLYRHLTVTINPGERVYYVTGEVKAPGRQLYAGQMTVTKAITTAGDFTDFANHKKVWLHAGQRPAHQSQSRTRRSRTRPSTRWFIPTTRSRCRAEFFNGSV